MSENKKLTVHEILSAIATAIYGASEHTNSKRHNAYNDEMDKAHWLECAMNDSVKFKFKDDKLILIYTIEITNPLKLTNDHVNKVTDQLSQVVKYIKTKYKDITNKTLTLTQDSDVFEQALPLSLVRQYRIYTCAYKIGGIDSVVAQNEKDVKELLKAASDKADAMTVFKKK